MAAAEAFSRQIQGGSNGTPTTRACDVERPVETATLNSLQGHVLQSEAQGDAIGGRKWSRLQTVAFIVLASGALWGAIGFTIYRVLTR